MAGVWRWILLYVLALVVLQLAVYYYVRRGEDGGVPSATASNGGGRGPPPEEGGWGDGWAYDPSSEDREDDRIDEESVRCPHCGAINDRESVFRFCRRCTGELGMR